MLMIHIRILYQCLPQRLISQIIKSGDLGGQNSPNTSYSAGIVKFLCDCDVMYKGTVHCCPCKLVSTLWKKVGINFRSEDKKRTIFRAHTKD